jgi:hypothetical protein
MTDSIADKASFWASIATILGLAGAWLTYFAASQVAKREQNDELQGLLESLKTELNEISLWASGGENSPGYLPNPDQINLTTIHPDWFNPSRQIYSFEYPTIRNITANSLLSKIRSIEEPLVLLNHALTNLFELHREYRSYVLSRPEIYSSTLHKLTSIPPGEPSDAEAEFMSHVFSYNRQLHQDLIGSRESTRLCLYTAYRSAKKAIDSLDKKPPLARTPWWYWVFHLLAACLAVKALLLAGAWLGFWHS